MRKCSLIVICLVTATIAAAQAQAPAPNPRDVQLVGDRFKPLKYDEMTPAQKTMMDHLVNGERRGAGGPFNVLLRSPEMGDLVQQFGASMRFHSSPRCCPSCRRRNPSSIVTSTKNVRSGFKPPVANSVMRLTSARSICRP